VDGELEKRGCGICCMGAVDGRDADCLDGNVYDSGGDGDERCAPRPGMSEVGMAVNSPEIGTVK
jgi:hypothetical protein